MKRLPFMLFWISWSSWHFTNIQFRTIIMFELSEM